VERDLSHLRNFKFRELVVNVTDILNKVLLILLQISACKHSNYYNNYNYNNITTATTIPPPTITLTVTRTSITQNVFISFQFRKFCNMPNVSNVKLLSLLTWNVITFILIH
jgi:hypothetical protein